jgi:hypothetical protein
MPSRSTRRAEARTPLLVREHEARRVEEYVRLRFGVEPTEDRSGLLASEPTATPAEPDEDEQFAAYMRRYYPGQHE